MPIPPVLRKVAFPMADHCNLKCKRCCHFSSVAPSKLADLDRFARDLRRLKELFSRVANVQLMGGEPLLHPELDRFILKTREICPETEIQIFTNGLLLKSAKPSFWEACAHGRAIIEISLYPAVKELRHAPWLLERARHVAIRTREMPTFFANLNLKGDSDPAHVFSICQAEACAPFLAESRLWPCGIPANVEYFNSHFGASMSALMPKDKGIDLFEDGLTGEVVLSRLNQPIANCRFCSPQTVRMPWERGTPSKADWDASTAQASEACRERSSHSQTHST